MVTLEAAADLIHDWSGDSKARFVFVRDVHGIMQAYNDPRLLDLHTQAAMVTPDGMPLVWLGKKMGHNVRRTSGPDLMEKIMSDGRGLDHYLLGGKPGVAEKLKARFETGNSKASIVGLHCPPFRQMSDEEISVIANDINRSGADVVWVGLSTPKQEYLMARLAGLVSSTMIGVGAAFDFHTGEVRRAPRWMQNTGLEWLYRFAQEPRRLWRRYLVMAPHFVWLLFWRNIRGNQH